MPWSNAESILAAKGRGVVTVSSAATLREAAQILDAHQIGALVVSDDAGRVRGVVSERDVAREVARHGEQSLSQPIASSLTRDVATAARSDTIDCLMRVMTERRIRHLPVVEAGRMVGIVSIGDVVKAKMEQAVAEAEALSAYISAGA